jgi:hypothetical protein
VLYYTFAEESGDSYQLQSTRVCEHSDGMQRFIIYNPLFFAPISNYSQQTVVWCVCMCRRFCAERGKRIIRKAAPNECSRKVIHTRAWDNASKAKQNMALGMESVKGPKESWHHSVTLSPISIITRYIITTGAQLNHYSGTHTLAFSLCIILCHRSRKNATSSFLISRQCHERTTTQRCTRNIQFLFPPRLTDRCISSSTSVRASTGQHSSDLVVVLVREELDENLRSLFSKNTIAF